MQAAKNFVNYDISESFYLLVILWWNPCLEPDEAFGIKLEHGETNPDKYLVKKMVGFFTCGQEKLRLNCSRFLPKLLFVFFR